MNRPAVAQHSPRISDATLARFPAATALPAPHATVELARVLQLVDAVAARTVAIGHGRHPASIAAAWCGPNRHVLEIVDCLHTQHPGNDPHDGSLRLVERLGRRTARPVRRC